VVGGLDRGGVETWLLNMVKALDSSRFQTDVLVDSTRNYAYNADLRGLGSNVLPCGNYRNPLIFWANLKEIYKDNGPYDLIHSHVHYYTGAILTMAAALGIRHRIAHVHPPGDLKPPSLSRTVYRSAMMRAIRKHATAVIACSHTTLESFVAACRPSATVRQVLYNGVDNSAYRGGVDRAEIRSRLGLPGDAFLITYIARFVPHKNHRQLIRLARALAGTPAHFAFVGSHGSTLGNVRRETTLLGNVSILTGLKTISEVLMASDLFIFPSLEEGFGVVALEAAAAGLPVVASDLPAIREALPPSHREWMFPLNDDEAAMKAIERIRANPALGKHLGEEGRSWAREFSMERSAASLASLYESLDARATAPEGV
jgi:glycosyltransferase involved in cell wall biosynthesis